MKRLLIFLCLALAGCINGAVVPTMPLERLGRPLSPISAPITWAAPTNALPPRLWIYRAKPATVDPQALSALVQLGGFQPSERQPVPGFPSTISYSSTDATRTLFVVPEWAEIRYVNSAADKVDITRGVPNEAEAHRIGTNWLSKLSIASGELAHRAGTKDPKAYKTFAEAVLYDRNTRVPTSTNLHMRGALFMRALDNIEFYGTAVRGGCSVEVGHDGRIANILLSWRNLNRHRQYPVLSTEKLMQFIRDGSMVWQPGPGNAAFPWNDVRELRVTGLTPYYYSEARGEFSKPSPYVCPFVMLELTARSPQTNLTVQVFSVFWKRDLSCPFWHFTSDSLQ